MSIIVQFTIIYKAFITTILIIILTIIHIIAILTSMITTII